MNCVMKSRHYIRKESKNRGKKYILLTAPYCALSWFWRKQQIVVENGRLRQIAVQSSAGSNRSLRQRLVGVYARCHVSSASTITSTITAVLPVYSRCLQHIRTSLPSLPYPMPCMVVLSCTPVSSLWNAKNWLCPAVERLEVQCEVVLYANGSVSVGNASVVVSVVVTAYLHAGIPWQDVASLLSVSPRTSCLGRAPFSGTCSNRGSQLADAVVIQQKLNSAI